MLAYGRHTRSFARSRVEIWYGAGGNEIKDEEEPRIETFRYPNEFTSIVRFSIVEFLFALTNALFCVNINSFERENICSASLIAMRRDRMNAY